MTYLYLVLAGLVAGVINSIAGGGIFAILPTMLAAGLSAKQVDASASFAVWLGQITSLYEDRKQLPKQKALIKQIIGVALVGSAVGALLLIYTPEANFRQALPYLNGGATLLFIAGPWIKKQRSARRGPAWVWPLFLFACGVYGGYFGGGLGLLMLSVLGLTTLRNIHEQNAVKLLTASVINLVAIILFTFTQLIIWRVALPAGAGALLGGWCGSRYFSGVSERKLRMFVVFIGAVTTVLLFIKLG